MPKISLHAKIEICLLCAIALGSCDSSNSYDSDGQFNDEQRDEIADISADVAYDVVLEDDRVQALENRVADLESRMSY